VAEIAESILTLFTCQREELKRTGAAALTDVAFLAAGEAKSTRD
jgi:hypothetical protein